MTRELTIVASDVAPVGGMERAIFEIARRLQARGWELTVIARSCALEDVRFHRLLSPSRPVSVALAASFVHGTWLVRRRARGRVLLNAPVAGTRADVVATHFCEAAYRRLGLPSRASTPSLPWRVSARVAAELELAAERWCLRPARAGVVTAVTDGLAGELRAEHPRCAPLLRTVELGVDLDRFRPDAARRAATRARLGIAPDALLACFVGGDWHRKGLRHALEALAQAPAWSLLVCGQGDADAFGADAAALGVAGRVVFHPPTPAVEELFSAADAFVFPTAYETFSMVALEAAASGLPVIAPPVSGIRDRVRDGVEGWLTPPDSAAIAAHLAALEDPQRRARMQAAARARAEHHSWERTVDAYEALLTG